MAVALPCGAAEIEGVKLADTGAKRVAMHMLRDLTAEQLFSALNRDRLEVDREALEVGERHLHAAEGVDREAATGGQAGLLLDGAVVIMAPLVAVDEEDQRRQRVVHQAHPNLGDAYRLGGAAVARELPGELLARVRAAWCAALSSIRLSTPGSPSPPRRRTALRRGRRATAGRTG